MKTCIPLINFLHQSFLFSFIPPFFLLSCSIFPLSSISSSFLSFYPFSQPFFFPSLIPFYSSFLPFCFTSSLLFCLFLLFLYGLLPFCSSSPLFLSSIPRPFCMPFLLLPPPLGIVRAASASTVTSRSARPSSPRVTGSRSWWPRFDQASRHTSKPES